ncbi:Na(+)/H(+) antiporter subunit D [Myxococcaceae bacterium]|nr:Na(+)/H(+) antiporter subunit D [Myxococcaceae bacterium]
MTDPRALLVAALLLPLALLAACLSPRLRQRVPPLLPVAPIPALLAALFAVGAPPLVLPASLLGITLWLDLPGALLLGTAALLWSAGGVHAAAFVRGRPDSTRFCVWWLLTLLGSLGIFAAADLASFYLFFAMVSLAAVGLVVHDEAPDARRAGAVTVGLALFGEAALLLGFVLLASATPGGSLSIRDAVSALPDSASREATLALLLTGFGIKIGLVPLHVWMPLAYSAAPLPAAAVMSGAAVKAGVIGLIRFLPLASAEPGFGDALAILGLASAFFGVAVGITQQDPRTVLAYSSVSQMGLLAAVFGRGMTAADTGAALAAAFYAAHHVLVKGGLFLALGVLTRERARRAWPVLLPCAVVALGLGGLPLTGGAPAKWAVKGPLGDGTVGFLAALAAAGSTLLMLHFLAVLVRSAREKADDAPAAFSPGPWIGIALAAVAVPWLLLPVVGLGADAELFAPKALWDSSWPVLLGGALALGLRPLAGALPRIPPGDWMVLAEGAAPAMKRLGAAAVRIDAGLRQWPAAGLSLLALLLGLATALAVSS